MTIRSFGQLPAALGVAGLAVCLGVGLAGCAQPAPQSELSASDVVASLGAVPIPPDPSDAATPRASIGHPQLLAMGAPVLVTLPDGTDATVTARGPIELTPYTGGPKDPTSTPGIVTLEVTVRSGSLGVAAGDLTSRDQTGKEVTLVPQGAPSVAATSGQSTQLHVEGTYGSGSAQVTWRHNGSVLVVWDFTIELD